MKSVVSRGWDGKKRADCKRGRRRHLGVIEMFYILIMGAVT